MKSPCEMLTKQQAAELGIDVQIKPDTDTSQGPGCEWEDADGDFFHITLLKNQPLGIAGIYRNHQQSPDAYFIPVDIAGFPGVFADGYDGRKNGSCLLSVGMTDTQIIVASVHILHEIDPCPKLQKPTEAVVTTMSRG